MKKKILIVGGTGFIGHNLILALKKNYDIYSLSKNKNYRLCKILRVKYVRCDLRNLNKLKKKFLKINNLDYIINLSGNINHTNKKETFDIHFKGFKNLVKATYLLKNLKLFIQIGTCLEYGRLGSPQKEKKICYPISYYGKSKYEASKFLEKSNIKKFIILRLYQIYGPYQKFDRLVPQVIKNCLKDKTFKCTEGSQYRDFLHIDDLKKLIIKILKDNNNKKEIYNVGYGIPFQVRNLIKKINLIIKKGKPDFGSINMRPDEIKFLYPNINKISKRYKWRAKKTLSQGLIETINHYKKILS